MRTLASPRMCWWWWLFLMPGWPARVGWGAVRTSQPFRGVLGVQPLSRAPQCVQVTPVSCCTIFSLIGHLTSGHQHPCSVEVMWEQEKELDCVQASSGLCLLWRALYFQALVFFLITKTNAGLRSPPLPLASSNSHFSFWNRDPQISLGWLFLPP